MIPISSTKESRSWHCADSGFSLFQFIGPIDDAAEFLDIRISQLHQCLGYDLAAAAAAAVDQDQLVLVRQHLLGLFRDLVVGDLNGTGDVALIVFLLRPGIEDHIPLLGVHDRLGFLRRDVHIHRLPVVFFSLPTGSQKDCRQKENGQFFHETTSFHKIASIENGRLSSISRPT